MGRGWKRSAGYSLFRLSTIGAARLWLCVESMDRVAACGIGQPDRPLIFLHSYCAGLLRAAAQGSAFPLDFLDVRSVHTGMRHDAPDGSLDHLEAGIRVVGSDQSTDRCDISGDGAGTAEADADFGTESATARADRGTRARERGITANPEASGAGNERCGGTKNTGRGEPLRGRGTTGKSGSAAGEHQIGRASCR